MSLNAITWALRTRKRLAVCPTANAVTKSPLEDFVTRVLVGLLTPGLHHIYWPSRSHTRLRRASNGAMAAGEMWLQNSVTAAGPSRNCTEVPCSEPDDRARTPIPVAQIRGSLRDCQRRTDQLTRLLNFVDVSAIQYQPILGHIFANRAPRMGSSTLIGRYVYLSFLRHRDTQSDRKLNA